MVTRRQRPRRAQTSQIESIVLQGMNQISSLDEMIVRMLIDAYTRSGAVLTNEIALIESQIRLAIGNAPEPITDAWLRRQRWYTELLDSVNGEIDRYTNTVRNLTAEVERIAARTGVAQSTRLGTEIGIGRVDTPVIERYIAALQPGSPLLESLAKWAQDERTIIERAIADGIIQGQGARTVSNVIQAQLGEAFDPYKATRIVRTEMMRAYRGAASDQLDEFPDDVIIGYRRIAGLDERTCGVCVALHNHISPTPHDDFHVMCRCIDVPVFSEDYVAAPEGGYMTGEDWLANQTEETQRRILGKARYEQWAEDGQSLTDMIEYRPNATWGGTSVMKPLTTQQRATSRSRSTKPSASTQEGKISQTSPDAMSSADRLYARAERAEPGVTRDLKTIESQIDGDLNAPFKLANGKTAYPLDARLKTSESTARKIATDADELITINPSMTKPQAIDAASSNIKDNLRYTYTVSEGTYGDDVVHVIKSLDDLGYERIAVKNMWKNDEGYTSVHALYRTKDGQPFEVQFHTARTIETKELVSHPLYEIQRNLPEGSPRWNEYQDKINAAWRPLRNNPPNISALP